jgi:ABC-type transport system involved in multi-copper enzyme maturation permease subunit
MGVEAQQSSFALPGFPQLLRKEMIDARRSKRLIIFTVVMALALLSIVTSVGAFEGDDFTADGPLTDAERVDNMLGVWAGIVAYLGSFMMIAATIDPVVRERSLGITAWIITKPVSRLSYLLSIAIGHTAAGIATIVLLPSIPILVIVAIWFQTLPLDSVIIAMAILSIEMTFLAFVNVALGVLFRSVTPVLLVSLAIWFLPNLGPVFAGEWSIRVLPAYLPVAAIVAATDPSEDVMVLTVPLVAVLLSGIAFLVAAQLFEGQEL